MTAVILLTVAGLFLSLCLFVLLMLLYHKQVKANNGLALRIAHLESSLDMLLDSQSELHKLIVAFMAAS